MLYKHYEKINRNVSIDMLRGMATILVVMGHCIQYGSGDAFFTKELYFENWLFQLIYSFHMPLFAFISGYVFLYSVKNKKAIEVLKKKTISIGVPLLCWIVIKYCIKLCMVGSKSDILSNIKDFLNTGIYSFWFLWAILFLNILFIVVHFVLKDNIIPIILCFALSFITPDSYTLVYVKFLLPFFAMGYYFSLLEVRNKLERIETRKKLIGALATTVLFFVTLQMFTKESFIYVSGVTFLNCESLIGQFMANASRLFCGTIGCAMCILWVEFFDSIHITSNKLARLGRSSLGVYTINECLNQSIFPIITSSCIFGVRSIIIETILMLLLCYISNICIQKFKISSFLLLGGR